MAEIDLERKIWLNMVLGYHRPWTRPLKFDEFENIVNQSIYVSATPADYELEKSKELS